MSLQDLSNQNNLETFGWQKPQQQATKQKKKITIRSERLQGSSEKTVAQGLQSPSGQKPTHSKTAAPSVIIANPTD